MHRLRWPSNALVCLSLSISADSVTTLLLRLLVQRNVIIVLKTTEDAAIKLYAPIIKMAALHAAVRTDSQEIDSPVQVS